jgi:uncharacterized membrane protein YhaH (DUF805 family)
MTFGESIKTVFSKYAVFRGRATRSEFWWWYLFTAIVGFALSLIMNIATAGVAGSSDINAILAAQTPFVAISSLVSLVFLLPTICVTVRRLHDTNRSGGWWWIQLIPFVGIIIIIVFAASPSVDQGNRFN